MGLDKAEIEKRVDDSLAAVGMQDVRERSAHLLSFGQKKRVATATVLSMRPDVLVFDEPSANLDPKARRQLITVLESLPVTKVIVTHDLPVAYELCERALILAQGRIVADGPIEEILSNTQLLQANDLELPYAFSIPPAGQRQRARGL
jgi:cobalt/nickel transport system ATP-binding protein